MGLWLQGREQVLLEKKAKLRAVLALFIMLAVKQRICEQNHDDEEELRRGNACASCLWRERVLHCACACALPQLSASRRRTVRREVDGGCV